MINVIGRNNVKVSGEGDKALIFSHGYGCTQNMWRLIAPAFEKDYQIVLFDHVGAGGSDLASYDRVKYSSLHGYASDLREICEQLDLESSIFVGHSVSAMIGILAAIEAPTFFEKLILIGPSPCYLNDGDYRGGFDPEQLDSLLKSLESNFQSWTHNMAPVIMGNPARPELISELVESFCKIKPEIAKHFAQVTFTSDNRKDLKKLQCESLILQCSQDLIAPKFVGEYLHREIQNSQYVAMKATGHCPHISAPEETIQEIQKFLGMAAPQSRRSA